MPEDIAYPTDAMHSTSKNLHTFLDEQWQQHQALFMDQADSYSNLLHTIAQLLPNAGGKVGALVNEVANYHQQYYNSYAALHTLTDQIEHAAQSMGGTDTAVAQTFKGMSE